jgi:hypothetical protein
MDAQPDFRLEVRYLRPRPLLSFSLLSPLLFSSFFVWNWYHSYGEDWIVTHYPYRFPHELIASTWAIIGKQTLEEAAARLVIVVVVVVDAGGDSLVVMAIDVLLVIMLGSGTSVSVAATALRSCAPGSDKASRRNNGLAVQSPARVVAATIRTEAWICGRMFVLGLEMLVMMIDAG